MAFTIKASSPCRTDLCLVALLVVLVLLGQQPQQQPQPRFASAAVYPLPRLSRASNRNARVRAFSANGDKDSGCVQRSRSQPRSRSQSRSQSQSEDDDDDDVDVDAVAEYGKRSHLASAIRVRGGGGGGGGGIRSIVSDFNDYIGASKSRSWWVLVFSIITDTYSVTLMKAAQAESSAKKLCLSFCGLFFSLSGFALALKSIDVSIAYAVWAAAGTAIVSIAGIVFFGERLDATKIACLSMIIIGVVGLELSDRHSA